MAMARVCHLLLLLLLLLGSARAQDPTSEVQLLPGTPAHFDLLKADPLECRSHLRFISTDLLGSPQFSTGIGLRGVLAEFPWIPRRTWQVVGMALAEGRFDQAHNTDLVAEDYTFGFSLMGRERGWSWDAGTHHHSAHIGDETSQRTGLRHLDYVNNEIGGRISRDQGPRLRLYAGGYHAFSQNHTDKPNRALAGVEYWLKARTTPGGVGPYAAAHLDSRQEVGWRVAATAVLGYAIPSPLTGRTLDLQLIHGRGPTPVRELYTTDETFTGVGFAFDL